MILGDGMLGIVRFRTVDIDEHTFRKRALRDACLCIGWIKLVSVVCNISMYFVVKLNSEGEFAKILQIMLLVGMIPAIIQGTLLFLGALRENALAICLALFTCVLLGFYDFSVGIMGVVHHINIAQKSVHYILTMLFMLQAFTLFTVLCHDAFIINTYRKVLNDQYIYAH